MMSQNHIELRKLEHVAVLARIGNYQRAALQLGVTQSALTRSIQALEKRLGARLFDRGQGGVRPTAVGRLLIARAEMMLRDAADLTRHLDQVVQGEAGEVSFGMSPLVAKAVLSDLLSDQLRERPNLLVSAAVRGPDALLPLLLAERIDFFVASSGSVAPHPAVDVRQIGATPSALLVRAGHPLAGRACLREDDLAQFPLVISTQPAVRFAGSSTIARPRRLSVVTDNYETLHALVRNNDAIWITSRIAYRAELERGDLTVLRSVEGMDVQETSIAIFCLDRVTRSPLAERMLDDVCRRIALLCVQP
jgi:DNA-binding transcriptional LysR family regulator